MSTDILLGLGVKAEIACVFAIHADATVIVDGPLQAPAVTSWFSVTLKLVRSHLPEVVAEYVPQTLVVHVIVDVSVPES